MRRDAPTLRSKRSNAARRAGMWAPALIGCASVLLMMCTPAPEPKPPPEPPSYLPADRGLRSVADFADIQGDSQRSLALFAEVGKVVTSPRCVNCHPSSERPLQGDQGLPHQPFVVAGDGGEGAAGLPCTACHGESNFRNMPGAAKWHLAPLEMAWQGRSLAQICAQLKDPQRNGGKSLSQLIEHVAGDELVAYGWAPPKQLTPAPGNQALFAQLFQAWVETGAHCPP